MKVRMRSLPASATALASTLLRTFVRDCHKCQHCHKFPAFQQNRHLSLLPTQQHPLLPLPSPLKSDASSVATSVTIQTSFLQSNISRIAFIRHGNTSPSPTGIDFERTLTDVGRAQSIAAGASYGVQDLYPYHEKMALCSPAPRCVETAELFLSASWQELKKRGSEITFQMPPLKLHPQMYDGTMQPEGSRLFRSIGYAPLRTYLDNPIQEDAEAARRVLGEYAHSCLDLLWDASSENSAISKVQAKNDRGTTLLVFAHAIYLPAAALGFAMAIGCGNDISAGNRDVDLILDTNTKEAEGYLVRIDTKTVSLLHRPES